MGSDGSLLDQVTQRIKPILDNVAVEGLRAWLRAIDFMVPARSRAAITELIAKKIASGELTEAALETALIGFEEASDMRIYLFRLKEIPAKPIDLLEGRLKASGIPIKNVRSFAGKKSQPMSPVYAHIEGGIARLKWAEEQQRTTLNERGDGVQSVPIYKRIVLIADFKSKTAELRMNPPENFHSYEDAHGHASAEEYYNAYITKMRDFLGCTLVPLELRPVIKKLVEQQDPRVVRIHIDNHTNQGNYKTKTVGPGADIRDSEDWKLTYEENGASWAWDSQSFYWLPKVSSGFLMREVFSHIDAEEGFVKVNADCSDDEVGYVVSQIRAR
jgi:hypothetical protein